MNSNDVLLETKRIININIDIFQNNIKNKTSIDCKTIHPDKPDFPIFHPASKNFFELKYYEQVLEWEIRDHLVHDILLQMLDSDLLCPDVNVYIYSPSPSSINVVRFSYSNEQYGEDYPFAFILEKNNERIGYRYSYSAKYCNNSTLKKELVSNKTDRIEIINWSDDDSFRYKQLEIDAYTNTNEIVREITLHTFFQQYFSEEIYQVYLSSIRDAVNKANMEIGFNTIPDLSVKYILKFKKSEIDYISNLPLRSLSYQIFDSNGQITEEKEKTLSSSDYDIIDNLFFTNQIYKGLIGKDKFAVCFMTSEYLYSVFNQRQYASFDYSTIVTGYFKSIELLLDRIKNAWIDYPIEQNWIKSNKNMWNEKDSDVVIGKNIWWRDDPKAKKTTQVLLEKNYERYFSTEIGPLTRLLEDSEKRWNISPEGKEIVINCIKNYRQGCRNEHLHKDIISDNRIIDIIRSNTILCMYYLLGGCQLAADFESYKFILNIPDDSYDRLYKLLLDLPYYNYFIKFENRDPVKAFKLLPREQDPTNYNIDGEITTEIKFVLLDSFSEANYNTEDEYHNLINSKELIKLSRTNMPTELWARSPAKGKIEIKW